MKRKRRREEVRRRGVERNIGMKCTELHHRENEGFSASRGCWPHIQLAGLMALANTQLRESGAGGCTMQVPAAVMTSEVVVEPGDGASLGEDLALVSAGVLRAG